MKTPDSYATRGSKKKKREQTKTPGKKAFAKPKVEDPRLRNQVDAIRPASASKPRRGRAG